MCPEYDKNSTTVFWHWQRLPRNVWLPGTSQAIGTTPGGMRKSWLPVYDAAVLTQPCALTASPFNAPSYYELLVRVQILRACKTGDVYTRNRGNLGSMSTAHHYKPRTRQRANSFPTTIYWHQSRSATREAIPGVVGLSPEVATSTGDWSAKHRRSVVCAMQLVGCKSQIIF